MEANRIVFCPVYVNVAFPNWCGTIFDMERQIVWTYDSFHRQDFLDDVESTINSHFMPLMMTRLLQRDDHSCGVLVVHWFEMYLKVARTASPDHGIPMPRGDKLGREKLKYCPIMKVFKFELKKPSYSAVTAAIAATDGVNATT
ncbi:hypothetical protein GQ600_25017 [Phytophthora cactorum]|nr:hypothetical protein GQ600_25017 [Phytophthora cactorum]